MSPSVAGPEISVFVRAQGAADHWKFQDLDHPELSCGFVYPLKAMLGQVQLERIKYLIS